MESSAEGDASYLTQRRLSLLGTILVVVVGVVVASRTVDGDRVVDAVRLTDPRLLAAAVGVYAASWPLRGHRYDRILGVMGRRCGRRFLTAAVFVSQLANLVVPARAGDGVRAYLLKTRRDVAYTTGLASLTVERLFDLLALACFGAVATGWLVLDGQTVGGESSPTILGAGIVAACAICAAVVLVALARSRRDFGAWLESRAEGSAVAPVVDAVVNFGGDVRVVAADPRAIGRIGVGSLAVWALDVLTAVLVLRAVTDALSPSTTAAIGTLAVTVGNLAKVLPLSQGGIGLYEAAFTAVVVAVSPVAAATALAAAIVDHALKNGVTVLGGAASALALNVSPTTVSEEPPQPEAESSNL
ncbi:flippase-like domain-containing protein [Halovenus sp. WSH3]|uniref:Flippase-like domain-containing protein n=1 Tax=Halovenus carboxidivorans TaxID=2692199 RepID=A0A6B0SY65_9EURY|nr:lysylphosphatidylglycerol synthase transmembrane domain-containing protein [Halovenus carboxidivorans]MXR50494.1 flippase-like domain-containing protein [Halovenus carboxidivorans]